MNKIAEAGPIRLALNIEDKVLADRLTALLAHVPGLQLVSAASPPMSPWSFPMAYLRQRMTTSC